MYDKQETLAEFETTYNQKTKHRKKCPACGKLIADGEKVRAFKFKLTKYYPVKGTMAFVVWNFYHVTCYNA